LKTTISFVLDTRLFRRLEKYRKKRGLSRSIVIQWAINDFLKKEESKDV